MCKLLFASILICYIFIGIFFSFSFNKLELF